MRVWGRSSATPLLRNPASLIRPHSKSNQHCRNQQVVTVSQSPRILYCHCAYAQVVPKPVKEQVLQVLSDSGVPFEAVPDLCSLSAARDPSLAQLASGEELKIAACYPRAVRW